MINNYNINYAMDSSTSFRNNNEMNISEGNAMIGEKYYCKFRKQQFNMIGEIKQVDQFYILVLVTKDHVAVSGSRYYRRHLYKINRCHILELWNSRRTLYLHSYAAKGIPSYMNGSSLHHLRVSRVNVKEVKFLKSERYYVAPAANKYYVNQGSIGISYTKFVSAGSQQFSCGTINQPTNSETLVFDEGKSSTLNSMHKLSEHVDQVAQNLSSLYIDKTVKPFVRQTVCAFAAKNFKDCTIMLDHDDKRNPHIDSSRIDRLERQLSKLQSLLTKYRNDVTTMHTRYQQDLNELTRYTRNAISLVDVTSNSLAKLKKFSPDHEDKCYLNSILLPLVGKATTKQLYDYAYAQGIFLKIDQVPRTLTHRDVEYLSFHNNRSFILIPYIIKTSSRIPFKYRYIEWYNQNPMLVSKFEVKFRDEINPPSRVFPKRKPKPAVRNYGGLEDSDSD